MTNFRTVPTTTENLPKHSPWGTVEGWETIEIAGLKFDCCHTASHGGLYLSDERAALIPACIKADRFVSDCGHWFEEDCAFWLGLWYVLRACVTTMSADDAALYRHADTLVQFWYAPIWEQVTGEKATHARKEA